MKNYVITIARTFGSGGKEIGTKVAEALGIPCYDRQLLKMASEKSQIDENLFVEANEKKRGKQLISSLRRYPNSNVLVPQDEGFISNDNLFNIVADIIGTIAWDESCVIMGKCADNVLRNYPNVIRLFIDAPPEVCIRSVMNKMNITERRARYLVNRTNSYRSQYYHYYTGGRIWKDPFNYDMFLNSDRIGRDECAKLIEAYVHTRFKDA